MMRKSVFTYMKWVIGLCSYLLVMSVLVGCKDKGKVCTECIHEVYVPLLTDQETDYPVLSQLCSSIDTVYLQNAGPDSYVKSVDDVMRFGDTIIVRSLGSLYMFDGQGRFLSSFCRQGKGHGYYRVIDRFDVRRSAAELYILDFESSSIFVYDMSGNFKRQIGIKEYITDFVVLPDGDFLFANPMKYRNNRRGIWRTDDSGNFLKQLVEFDPEFAHVSINNPYLNHINDSVVGIMGVEDNDRFYTYSADTIAVTCKMTTDIVIPDEMKKSDKVFVSPEREYTKCGYLETDRFLYFVATNYGANLVMSFVDKSNWNSYLMYVFTSEFKQNTETIEAFPFLVSSYGGTLVGFYDAGMVLDNEVVKKRFPSMKADSNPVLLFYNE